MLWCTVAPMSKDHNRLAAASIDGSNGGTNISFDEYPAYDTNTTFRMSINTSHFCTSQTSEFDLPNEQLVDELIEGLQKVRARMAELRAAGRFTSYYDRR